MNIIEDKYIFDPYRQEFVLKTSPSGQNILYLEKICLSCKNSEIYDQIKNKCVVKKRLNDIDQKQFELCQEYIKIKKQVLPLDKNQLLGLLNIKFNGKNLIDHLNQPLNNYKSEPMRVIYDLIKFIYQDWLRLSSTGAVIYILQEVYKMIGTGVNYNIFYYLNIFITFISKFYNFISKTPGFITKFVHIIQATFRLFYNYRYLPLYYSKTAIYFILGAVEYSIYNFLSMFSQRILDNSIINTIVLFFSKEKTYNVEVVSVERDNEDYYNYQLTKIVDSVPNYRYYSRGGLLYGMFEEKTEYNFLFFKKPPTFKVEYLQQKVKEQINNKKQFVFESFTHFYKQLTKHDLELLKKKNIVSQDNKYLFLENLGLQDLKDPQKQIKQLILYKTNEKSNVTETGLLYINNAGEEEIKSIYATAQRQIIDNTILKRFEREISPIYKIFKKELNILNGLIDKSEHNYNKKKEELQNSIKELLLNIDEYKRMKNKYIAKNKELSKLKDKVKNDSKRSSQKKIELMNRYIKEQKENKDIINDLQKKINKTFKMIKKYNGLYLKDFYVHVENKESKKVSNEINRINTTNKKKSLRKIKQLTQLVENYNLNYKISFIPQNEINNYTKVITMLNNIIKEIDGYISNYSTTMRNSSQNYDTFINLLKKIGDIKNKIQFNKSSFTEKYSKLLDDTKNVQSTSNLNPPRLLGFFNEPNDKATETKVTNRLIDNNIDTVKIENMFENININVNDEKSIDKTQNTLLEMFDSIILKENLS